MDINTDWNQIRIHFSRSFRSSLHVAIASVDHENKPTVTPIGSLFLNEDHSGFYFEKFPSKLPVHANANTNICILAVNSGVRFWLKALYKLKFKTYPAIKLYGNLGERRKATKLELMALKRRMRMTKRLKGHSYLWNNMEFVREITISRAEKIELGKMTSHL